MSLRNYPSTSPSVYGVGLTRWIHSRVKFRWIFLSCTGLLVNPLSAILQLLYLYCNCQLVNPRGNSASQGFVGGWPPKIFSVCSLLGLLRSDRVSRPLPETSRVDTVRGGHSPRLFSYRVVFLPCCCVLRSAVNRKTEDSSFYSKELRCWCSGSSSLKRGLCLCWDGE